MGIVVGMKGKSGERIRRSWTDRLLTDDQDSINKSKTIEFGASTFQWIQRKVINQKDRCIDKDNYINHNITMLNSQPFEVQSTLPEGGDAPQQHKVNVRSLMYLIGLLALGYVSIIAVSSNSSSSKTWSSSGKSKLKSNAFYSSSVPTNKDVRFGEMSDEDVRDLYTDFKDTFGFEYTDEDEDAQRYENFKTNLLKADERNDAEAANGGSAVHGVTKFSAASQEELAMLTGGFAIRPETIASTPEGEVPKRDPESSVEVVDWIGIYTTPIKNQGYCGSCWAFSATEQIESDAIRVGILDTKMYLSPQQIVSCDSGDYGCDGGWTEGAYDYVISAGGLVSVEDYPYKSYWDTTGECTLDVADAKLATIDSFYKISKEEDMEAYVLSTGPLSVCLDASSWYTYVWGVVTTCGDEVDHCVQVVGLNAEDDYWIVRNSWGVDWGMEGYILLESGVDMCNITSWASYTNAVEP